LATLPFTASSDPIFSRQTGAIPTLFQLRRLAYIAVTALPAVAASALAQNAVPVGCPCSAASAPVKLFEQLTNKMEIIIIPNILKSGVDFLFENLFLRIIEFILT
jgi:hypothetical protein